MCGRKCVPAACAREAEARQGVGLAVCVLLVLGVLWWCPMVEGKGVFLQKSCTGVMLKCVHTICFTSYSFQRQVSTGPTWPGACKVPLLLFSHKSSLALGVVGDTWQGQFAFPGKTCPVWAQACAVAATPLRITWHEACSEHVPDLQGSWKGKGRSLRGGSCLSLCNKTFCHWCQPAD